MKCAENHNHPPTLPQFINSCKAIENRGKDFFIKSVDSKSINSEVAEFNLKKMREYLL
jgi:hypothetical protein